MKRFLVVLECLLFILMDKTAFGSEAVLLDTRTAISDLGWTMPAGSEWQEMTSSDKSGNQRRMLMACQIQNPHPNNWMRSQYIPVDGAQRIYVEMEFTIRSCEGIAEVATCKETFNLFYYETDRDEATTTFPPWNEGAYTKVDTIAADQRFEPGSKQTNLEIRDIGPLTKKGVYLAVQDTGACVALMHVRVYYMYCDRKLANLAVFSRTRAGPEVTSLVEAKGACVPFAIEKNGIGARLHCNGKGIWMVPSGSCECIAGYAPNTARTQCEACRPGYYKASTTNQACMRCPDYSLSAKKGSSICECMEGYYRSPVDEPELPCTKPPSKPINMQATVNGTSLKLAWDPPQTTGGRSDISYRVSCQTCAFNFEQCESCSNHEHYSSPLDDVTTRHLDVTQLSLYSRYKFEVCAVNGVTSEVANGGSASSSCVETTFSTSQSGTSAVLGLQAEDISPNSFTLTWQEPLELSGNLLEYHVLIHPGNELKSSSANLANHVEDKFERTNRNTITISGLRKATTYIVKVRAQTVSGTGPYSAPVRIETTDRAYTFTETGDGSSTPQDDSKTILIIAIVGGMVFVLIFLLVFIICKRKRKAKKHLQKKDIELSPAFNCLALNREFNKEYKLYVDPKTYEDPGKAVLDFTKEIQSSFVEMEEAIGQGEFSEVFKGRLIQPGVSPQLVAIKTLKMGHNSNRKSDFLTEASIMGQFDHPNVIRLEGVVTKSSPMMIIMEYMENGSLDGFLKKHDGEFSVVELVRMLRNIATGMKYLSDMGYVHRDLAARNVLVNSEMTCKVSDFGLSRELDDEAEAIYTARGEKIPLRWTAPEAISFQRFTSASDVWSFGIVMWEVMSYGEIPYWEMSNQTVMTAVENGNRLPAPLHCPQPLHQLMLDCWKKDRNQRPKFDRLLSALKELLRDSWKLEAAEKSCENNDECADRRFILPVIFSDGSGRNLLRDSLQSSTPAHNTDSGINEDSDEESPMINTNAENLEGANEEDVTFLTLRSWLEKLGMTQYHDSFVRNGCTSVDHVSLLNSSDLTRMGILVEEHQETLMNNVRNFPSSQYIREGKYEVAV